MELSKEQLDFFDTFGFIKFPQLLADSIDWITEEFTNVFPDHVSSVGQHDGTKRTCVVQFIDRREKLNTLLDDPRIHGIAKALLGDDFNYMGSDGNYYTGDTGWHRDGFHHKYRHIKIAFYLDNLDGNSGALRVIPGSHRLDDKYGSDLGAKAFNPQESWNISGDQVPAIALDVKPGDLLIFNHNTFHAAFKGNSERRMFTINLCQRYEEQDLPELQDYISGSARFWIDRVYNDTLVQTASPQRMVHLEQVMANDGHLAAKSAEARKVMAEPSRG